MMGPTTTPTPYSVEIADHMGKPIPRLIFERRYGLATIAIVVSSMAFVCALAVRDMTKYCTEYLIGVEDSSFKKCASGVAEGFIVSTLVLLAAVCIVRFYFGALLPTVDRVSDLV